MHREEGEMVKERWAKSVFCQEVRLGRSGSPHVWFTCQIGSKLPPFNPHFSSFIVASEEDV